MMEEGSKARARRKAAVWALVLAAVLQPWAADAAAHAHAHARTRTHVLETRVGLASHYARRLQGRETASGEPFDRHEMVAAHPYYPLGTRVRITARESGRAALVRINDRGPARKSWKKGVIIDLSPAAASKLGIVKEGLAPVKVEVLAWGHGARK
ncbi:MAG TPA: septal ring lytic transglycosylase RlpA family protein [Aromatoleum sp.]|uniref:septal ring lytic transglycosylase RlpA family protein n=1 Tax=Aromatoleum sp. TaxID=2307007 RepID=UPI002B481A6A|nr:septal ring lytic transglycosylase RlpA family protein [Aromatoleum sp.]HJV25592.1 septal ring lytic transglycosylase RlpA family protein [Aromatoleum sp.]